MPNVTIYTTNTCGWCQAAKDLFVRHNVQYQEKNVASDLTARQEMVSKSNQLGVPVIDVDGQIIVGYNEERLTQLLSAA